MYTNNSPLLDQPLMLLIVVGIGAAGLALYYLGLFCEEYVFVPRGTGWRRPRVRFELDEKRHVLRQYTITKARAGLFRRAVRTEKLDWSVDLSKVRFASASPNRGKHPQFLDLWDRDPELTRFWDEHDQYLPEKASQPKASTLATYAPVDLERQPEIYGAVLDYLLTRKAKGKFDTNASLSTGEQHTWTYKPLSGEASPLPHS